MRRWVAILAAAAVGSVTLSPSIALADNCSSLKDCWEVAQGAVGSIVGAVVAGIIAIFGGRSAASAEPHPDAPQVTVVPPPVAVGPEGSGSDIEVKRGADIDGLSQAMRETFDDIREVFSSNGAPRPVITSGNDSIHRGSRAPGTDCSSEARCRQTSDSRHYQDDAIDIRGRDMPDDMQDRVADDLQERLGTDYDVESEHFPNNPNNDHIHIEYDPR